MHFFRFFGDIARGRMDEMVEVVEEEVIDDDDAIYEYYDEDVRVWRLFLLFLRSLLMF